MKQKGIGFSRKIRLKPINACSPVPLAKASGNPSEKFNYTALSSDVAAAVLAVEEGESPRDASKRVEVVMELHSTLRIGSVLKFLRDRSKLAFLKPPQS